MTSVKFIRSLEEATEIVNKAQDDAIFNAVLGDISDAPGPSHKAAEALYKATLKAAALGLTKVPNLLDLHTGLETGIMIGYYMFAEETREEK